MWENMVMCKWDGYSAFYRMGVKWKCRVDKVAIAERDQYAIAKKEEQWYGIAEI